MAQVVQHLLSKWEDLISIPTTTKQDRESLFSISSLNCLLLLVCVTLQLFQMVAVIFSSLDHHNPIQFSV
jgi:hypothetical protein